MREIEVDAEIVGQLALALYTDLPGGAHALRHTATLNASGTLTRRPIEVRLPGTTRGKQYRIKLSGAGTCRLFGMRIRAKAIGSPTPAGWQWYAVPGIPQTPDGWTFVKLPIRETPIVPTWVDLPIDAIE